MPRSKLSGFGSDVLIAISHPKIYFRNVNRNWELQKIFQNLQKWITRDIRLQRSLLFVEFHVMRVLMNQ